MHDNQTEEESLWNSIEPFLDDALAKLAHPDREALLLRFFSKKSHLEIGTEIGATEEAARKRVGRALERLRVLLQKRGISVPTTSLIAGLSANAVSAAPPALLAAVTSGLPLAASAVATKAGMISLMTTKAKILASSALILAVATPVWIQQLSINRLNREHQILAKTRLEEVEKLKNENSRLAGLESELHRREREHRELLQLRNEVSSLRTQNQALKDQLSQKSRSAQQSSAIRSEKEPSASVRPEWEAAARLRNMRFRGPALNAEELEWLEAAKPIFENLEREPEQFAQFQASLIQEALPGIATEKLDQIQQIIQETYRKAVGQNLDLPSKPSNESEEWVARRHQLDREGTRRVQDLLTQEERVVFDSRFLGVMGVDLGTGVNQSDYPAGFLGSPTPPSAPETGSGPQP